MWTEKYSVKSVFAQKGYAATSILDICEAAKCSKGGIYHHFKNKEDLFIYITEHTFTSSWEQWVAIVSNYSTMAEKLYAFADYFVDTMQRQLSKAAEEFILSFYWGLRDSHTFLIVVLNRCTDRTKEVAEAYNCVTISEDSKNLSKIRNAGVRAARGEIIVTIDADSWMAENMLDEVDSLLKTGIYIGAGVGAIRFERVSTGIIFSAIAILFPLILRYGNISVGMFWCYKKDFNVHLDQKFR